MPIAKEHKSRSPPTPYDQPHQSSPTTSSNVQAQDRGHEQEQHFNHSDAASAHPQQLNVHADTSHSREHAQEPNEMPACPDEPSIPSLLASLTPTTSMKDLSTPSNRSAAVRGKRVYRRNHSSRATYTMRM